jgi:hypothetical protein
MSAALTDASQGDSLLVISLADADAPRESTLSDLLRGLNVGERVRVTGLGGKGRPNR